jgi:glycosyltransferase involved in cell wall biosynthesis
MYSSNKEISLSVVMAVHNCQKYISFAIESILVQTYHDFEFVIVDDLSTDNTAEILCDYALKDGRIKLIKNTTNIGLTRSLNLGIEYASGSLIARMDGDDISYQNRLADQINFMLNNPDVVCLGAQAHIIDDDGDIIEDWIKPIQSEEIKTLLVHEGGGQIIHPLAIFRRAAFEAVGGYDPRYVMAQDYDLLLKFADIGDLGNLPEFLLKYRRHKGAITSSKRNAQINYAIKALLEAQERRSAPVDCLVIPDVVYPYIQIPYHLDLARRSLRSGNYNSAKKHAFLAKSGLTRHSVLWYEMCCIICPSKLNGLIYKLLLFLSSYPLTARGLRIGRKMLSS